MRREKELAERRKNEPQLDSNQDQLVRKIFSKFRRDRSQLQAQYSVTDVEKGGEGDSKVSPVSKPDGAPTVDVVSSGPTSGSPAGSTMNLAGKLGRPATKSKWSRFSSGSTSDSVKSDSCLSRPPPRDSKMFTKLQNMSSSEAGIPRGIQRQDTIEEGIETIIRVTKSTDDGDDIDKTDLEPNLKKSETPSLQRRLSQFQPSCSDFKEMQATITEFKADTSRELQNLNQRMDRLEDLIQELLSKLDQRNVPKVNTEQQTYTPQFTKTLISPVSDRDSASTTTEGHPTPQISNLLLRKRRSKTRTKGIAPGIPYRSISQRSRQLLRTETESHHETLQVPGTSSSSTLLAKRSDEDVPTPPSCST